MILSIVGLLRSFSVSAFLLCIRSLRNLPSHYSATGSGITAEHSAPPWLRARTVGATPRAERGILTTFDASLLHAVHRHHPPLRACLRPQRHACRAFGLTIERRRPGSR